LVLDLRRLALAHRDVLGKLAELFGQWPVPHAELAQERSVAD
jgi:hypothetical protein